MSARQYNFRVIRRTLRMACKVVGCGAALAAMVVPLSTSDEWLIFGASVLVGVTCLIAWSALDDEPGSIALWPPSTKMK
jgi:hypothetical protein